MEIKNIGSISELLELCDYIYKKYDSLYILYDKYNFKIQFDYNKYISFSDLNYKRNLICSSNCVDIYLICWKKGQKSKIHDHPEKGCIMYVLSGKLTENIYHRDFNEKLSYISSKILNENDVAYNFGIKILHQIIAESDTMSLHIYHKGYVPNYYG